MTQSINSSQQAIMITQQDFERLEAKIDQMAAALIKLILVEERQSTQGIRLGEVEKSLAVLQAQYSVLDKKLDKWINVGIGVWGVILVLFAAAKQFFPGR